MTQYKCPNCGAKLESEKGGVSDTCPLCGHTFTVPSDKSRNRDLPTVTRAAPPEVPKQEPPRAEDGARGKAKLPWTSGQKQTYAIGIVLFLIGVTLLVVPLVVPRGNLSAGLAATTGLGGYLAFGGVGLMVLVRVVRLIRGA